MKMDVIIKSHPKDYVKLPYVIDSIKYVNPQPENIYLINPDRYSPLQDSRITVLKDSEVMPGIDRNKLSYRPSWLFAVIMAVWNDITENDYYLDIDSDNFFVNPIDFFEDEHPIFWMSPEHSHYCKPYFRFSEKLYGFGRLGTDSFIIDFMLYNKQIAREMRKDYKTFAEFYDRICELTTPECYIADKEIYPNYCLKYYPDLYRIKNTHVILQGRKHPANYESQEIKNILTPQYNEVAITLHTWTT